MNHDNQKDGEQLDRDEQDIGRLLREVGRREDVPADMKARWELGFKEELNLVRERRSRRKYGFAAIAATLVVAVLIGVQTGWQANTTRELVVLSAVGSAQVRSEKFGERMVNPGMIISSGSQLDTGDKSYLAMQYASHEIRLNTGTSLILHDDSIELLEGEIYVSDRGSDNSTPLRVVTTYATIEDIGTQFTVMVKGEQVVSTVREGSIVVAAGDQSVTAVAGDTHASQVSTGADLRLHTAEAKLEWDWIYQVSAEYTLEGQSAYEFLQWSVSQTGMRLKFASANAEFYARQETLHGSFVDLKPNDINPVLDATYLRARVMDGAVLEVSLQR